MELQKCLDIMDNKGMIKKTDIGIHLTQKFKDEYVKFILILREKMDGDIKNNKISIEDFYDSVIVATVNSFLEKFNNEEISNFWEVISKFKSIIKIKELNPIDIDTNNFKDIWEELKEEKEDNRDYSDFMKAIILFSLGTLPLIDKKHPDLMYCSLPNEAKKITDELIKNKIKNDGGVKSSTSKDNNEKIWDL